MIDREELLESQTVTIGVPVRENRAASINVEISQGFS